MSIRSKTGLLKRIPPIEDIKTRLEMVRIEEKQLVILLDTAERLRAAKDGVVEELHNERQETTRKAVAV